MPSVGQSDFGSRRRSVTLELRLRFKTPDPNRLKKYDERAFDYYYAQVRYDFDASIVTKNTTQELNLTFQYYSGSVNRSRLTRLR